MAKDLKVTNNITIENAHVMFRNFSGEESKFNTAGKRNFCVQLDSKLADDLEKDGWAVKRREPIQDGDDEFCFLQVAVSFDNIPPNIWLVTSRNKTRLNRQTVGQLDYADIKRVDVVIRPYNWEVNGKTGVKAYVKNMYVTIDEDELDQMYADIPDSSRPANNDEEYELPF